MTKLFTSTTWAETLKGQYLTHDLARGRHGAEMLYWTDQHDLAVQLAGAQPALTFEMARELVSATCSGLPITLTWETDLRRSSHIETTTATVIITELGAPGPNIESQPGRAHIHYWGFGHPIYLNQIVAVEVPPTTRTYRDAE